MKKLVVRILAAAVLLATLGIAYGAPAAHASAPCYVNHAAGGTNDGTSWTNAFTNLQFALSTAACGEIWVAQGIYKPGSGGFNMGPGHVVYGGFAGGETTLGQRDPGAHVTILSGDIDNNDTTTGGLDMHVSDIQGTNALHVVFMDGTWGTPITPTNTALVGLTLTGGQATGNNGGGLYCYGSGAANACSPSLLNLTFVGNTANDGGGLYNDGHNLGSSSPVLINVTFVNNTANTSGGAIYNSGSSAGDSIALLNNVTFSGNSAGSGGAIFNDGVGGRSSPQLADVTLKGNSAGSLGGAVFNDASFLGVSNPLFTNAILWGNTAGLGGNEIFNWGGPTPTVDHSVIQGSGGSGLPWDTSLGIDNGGNLDADPKLGPLQDNGGYTNTMALLAGSSALDAGNDVNCYALDQRDVWRTQEGSHCDMGAYERIPAHAGVSNGYQTDVGVFRPSTGRWFVRGAFATTYGLSGDDPLPYDFNGDGLSDVAVYRPSTSAWFVQGQFATLYGLPGDIPVPGDYDGNGTTDLAVYRPSTSAWYVKNQFSTVYGIPGDIPVPADYNGDGLTDVAVYRPSTSAWYVKNQFSTIFGLPGDIPLPSEWSGQVAASIAVYRPSTSAWYFRGYGATIYGVPGDIPVPGDWNGDEATEIAVFRPSTRGWFIQNQFSTIYGLSGDYPLPAPDTNADGDPYQ